MRLRRRRASAPRPAAVNNDLDPHCLLRCAARRAAARELERDDQGQHGRADEHRGDRRRRGSVRSVCPFRRPTADTWPGDLASARRLAPVASLRETSVLFATLIGARLLREKLNARRWAGVVAVVAGVIEQKAARAASGKWRTNKKGRLAGRPKKVSCGYVSGSRDAAQQSQYRRARYQAAQVSRAPARARRSPGCSLERSCPPRA